jgi:hypothetical protein
MSQSEQTYFVTSMIDDLTGYIIHEEDQQASKERLHIVFLVSHERVK